MWTERRTAEYEAIIAAYTANGYEVLPAKGGGFHVRHRGYVTLKDARKETGIDMAEKREKREKAVLYGDLAWVAKLNRIRT